MYRDPGRTQGRTETVSVGEAARAAEALAARLPRGTRIGGRYRLDEVLGSGGYGVVYGARDERDGRSVAVKVLRADRLSPAALARFRREAVLARGIEHPHLVAVLDSGCDGDRVYLVMARVEGENLADRLKRGPLAPAEAVRLAHDLLSGLRALHRAGIVHRDIKPANVLLDDRDPSSVRARLADFGLALRWGADETRATGSAELLGTVEYLAPEQALEGRADARSDLFSLGVVLFEMLTGEPPFRGRSSLGTLVARLQSPPADVRELRPEVPEWLAAVVTRLLARRPAERYPSADAVLRELRTIPGRRGLPAGPRRLVRAAAGIVVSALLIAVLLGMRPDGGSSRTPGGATIAEPSAPVGVLAEVSSSSEGLSGLTDDGAVLWRRAGIDGRLVPARLEPGEGTVLVGTVAPRDRLRDLHGARLLSVLDPATGETVRTIELATAADSFPGFAPRYRTRPVVADLDGDGLDEVLVVFHHDSYSPSFVTLYEPLLGRSRVVFVASGHHSFTGMADVDGDGRDELLFQGVNDRMDLSGALAAVRLAPPVNRPAPPGEWGSAATPDLAPAPGPRDTLAWYALLPRRFATWAPPDGPVEIDRRARTVTVHGVEGPPAVISFDGFSLERPSKVASAERRRLRRELYGMLRESRRLSASGFHVAALRQVQAAERTAGRIHDPRVLDHARRLRATLLVEEGSFAAAEARFRELASTSHDRREIAFTAARSFHLAGEPERALTWYRDGFRSSARDEGYRSRYEYLEGVVLCLEELGRPEEALGEVERFLTSARTAPPADDLRHAGMLRAYLLWRRGELRPADLAAAGEQGPRGADLFVYLQLEFDLALGEAPESLLPRAERALESATETVPMLLSLYADLLLRLDRPRAATAAAASALDELERRRDDELYPRAFRDLVEARHRWIVGSVPGAPAAGERLAVALPARGRRPGGR